MDPGVQPQEARAFIIMAGTVKYLPLTTLSLFTKLWVEMDKVAKSATATLPIRGTFATANF